MLTLFLVAALGSPDFETRENAETVLLRLGPLAYPSAVSGLSCECPEVRARCSRVLTPVRVEAERVRVAAMASWWLDRPFPPTHDEVCDLYADRRVRVAIVAEVKRRTGMTFLHIDPAATDRLDCWRTWYMARDLSWARARCGVRSWIWCEWVVPD